MTGADTAQVFELSLLGVFCYLQNKSEFPVCLDAVEVSSIWGLCGSSQFLFISSFLRQGLQCQAATDLLE